ncbi:MAG: ParB/RepB/Spo0J family partition protein [Calditrichia bacterium]|jgi:ParB family chromosome partitioning protein|nr:ParB/RepB/Spo0J family partition protein [Calditrichia bacterium]
MRTKRLGKGLSALIPDQVESSGAVETSDNQLVEVKVAEVKPNPYQPRVNFDEQALAELKDSIREKGLIQPITVRRINSHFELIAGERRLRAAIELGLDKIPAYVMHVETKEEMLELAIVENVQRERLNPIEQANAYQRLLKECNLTQDEIAKKIGKDRSTITNMLRLLRLPRLIQKSVEEGEISVGHARTLLALEVTEQQIQIWKKVVKNDISVRKLEKLVKELSEVKPKQSIKTKKKSVHILKIEDKLRDVFGTKVSVRTRNEGGSIEIEFYSPEDLNRILEIFEKID